MARTFSKQDARRVHQFHTELLNNLQYVINKPEEYKSKIRNSVDVMVSQELMDKSSDYYRKIRDFYNSLIQLPDITEDLEETTDQDAAGSVVSFVNKMSKRFDDQDGFYSWRDLRYVEERQVDGKWFQMPIEIGSSKGITMVEKTSEKGTIYEVIAYPPEVQKEVVEHFIGER